MRDVRIKNNSNYFNYDKLHRLQLKHDWNKKKILSYLLGTMKYFYKWIFLPLPRNTESRIFWAFNLKYARARKKIYIIEY